MNVFRAVAVGAALQFLIALPAGAASNFEMVAEQQDSCCVIVSVGPAGRAVLLQSLATRQRWILYLSEGRVVPSGLLSGIHVDFDAATGLLTAPNNLPISGAVATISF